MKKVVSIISVLLVLSLILISVLTVHAVSLYTDGDFTFADIDQYNVALYDYSGEDSVLTIPAVFNDRRVSQIYNYAFEDNTAITKLDFSSNPRYITNIGVKSFAGCTSLTGELVLPSSLATIGLGAFQGCTGISSLTINMGLHDISEQCFNRCSGLKTVILPETIETIGRLAFANIESFGKIYIPRSVTYIDPNAFYNSYLTLYVYNGSYAHSYAEEKGLSYVLIDPPQPEPTEEPTEEPTTAPTDAPTEPVTPTVAPTEPVTEAPTETSGYYLGDVNGDNTVDVIDSTLIQRYLASVAYPDTCVMMHGDVDGDGVVTILDATYIGRYNARIEVRYPIGEWQAE